MKHWSINLILILIFSSHKILDFFFYKSSLYIFEKHGTNKQLIR